MSEDNPLTGELPLSVRAAAPDVPNPDSRHGIVWEPLTVAHRNQMSSLIARIEAQDNPPYRTSEDEVAEMLGEASQWRGIAGFATRGIARGRMIAFAQVSIRFPGHVECVCHGGVDPSFRRIGLGGTLVAWQEGISRQMISETPGHARAQIVCYVEAGEEDLEEQLKLRGFHWARTYYELRADLHSVPEMPDLGRYLTIEPWGPEWEEPARRAANRLNEQEWGRPPAHRGTVAPGPHLLRPRMVVPRRRPAGRPSPRRRIPPGLPL